MSFWVTRRKKYKVMIDFVKIKLGSLIISDLTANPLLVFIGNDNRATGESYRFPMRAEYNGLKFEIKSDRTTILSGSLHKYWNSINNGKKQNFNDFSFSNIVTVMRDLKDKFKLDIYSSRIQNIEFGVNISTTKAPSIFLKSLISHKGVSFNTLKGKGKYYCQCERDQYIIKVYDKGLQNSLAEHILRFEIKVTTMEKIKKEGVKTLSDLLNLEKIIQLGKALESMYEDIIMFDNSMSQKEMNERERRLVANFANPRYWEELKEKKTENYYNKRKRFKVILSKYDGNRLKDYTLKLITEKWHKLTEPNNETLQELINLLKPNIPENNHSNIVSNSVIRKYADNILNIYRNHFYSSYKDSYSIQPFGENPLRIKINSSNIEEELIIPATVEL